MVRSPLPNRSAFRLLSIYGRLIFDVFRSPILLSVAAAGNVILLICAALFFNFEHGVNPHVQAPFDAVWWAFSTVTTVGYGDVSPMTAAGRVVAIILMIGGVTCFVSFTALLVTIASARATEEIVGFELRETRVLGQMADSLARIEARLGALERALATRETGHESNL